MLSFPSLRTGAVAQYPSGRHSRFSTQVLEFIDGREQRFREYAGMLRRWVIQLDALDEGELAAVANFVDEAGPVAAFSFRDPWDGSEHPNCVVEGSEFATHLVGESRGRTELIIRENL